MSVGGSVVKSFATVLSAAIAIDVDDSSTTIARVRLHRTRIPSVVRRVLLYRPAGAAGSTEQDPAYE
jgi:hypothetical protein